MLVSSEIKSSQGAKYAVNLFFRGGMIQAELLRLKMIMVVEMVVMWDLPLNSASQSVIHSRHSGGDSEK